MTITLDSKVYDGLHKNIGKRNISYFLEDLARPHVIKNDLEDAYKSMSEDSKRENDAQEWQENLITTF